MNPYTPHQADGIRIDPPTSDNQVRSHLVSVSLPEEPSPSLSALNACFVQRTVAGSDPVRTIVCLLYVAQCMPHTASFSALMQMR